MGPNFPLRANETRKENGIEIFINTTDQATKYVRPVLFHSLPTKTSLVTGRKLCFFFFRNVFNVLKHIEHLIFPCQFPSKRWLRLKDVENVFLHVNSPTSLCDAKKTCLIECEGPEKWRNIIIFFRRIEGTFEDKG